MVGAENDAERRMSKRGHAHNYEEIAGLFVWSRVMGRKELTLHL